MAALIGETNSFAGRLLVFSHPLIGFDFIDSVNEMLLIMEENFRIPSCGFEISSLINQC